MNVSPEEIKATEKDASSPLSSGDVLPSETAGNGAGPPTP
jgi:hypothetical protein